ncbi:MAG: phenylalanine--tRNA ligase subunit beta [Candidatus Edwardsbacteria bacterium]|nr:phenylalanine--tRNA ligase subunit beta [Candidatus Edwardsbacteria bacterium]
MNITYNWLKEFIDFPWPVKELADKLTFAGVEVEAIEKLAGGDHRLELEVTPNRPDCLSFLGLAREVAALSGLAIKRPDCSVVEKGDDITKLATVSVEDVLGCPRYVARAITGVKIAESPDWLKAKINTIGLRPINNAADITNLVLYELGQPLHAFDLDKLAGRAIVVRRAKKGEALTTLDGAERKLDADHLVIADAARPVALAGIIGGIETEISASTKNVLLESAYFEPSLIRRGSHGLGLKTDASYRFERGADPNALEKAADRCARLIAEIAGGIVAKGRIDVSAQTFEETTLTLRPDRANKLLGITIPVERMIRILNDLELRAWPAGDTIKATIPTFRRDLEREADLIEEVGRIHGFDKLPDERIAPWPVPGLRRPADTAVERIAQAMISLGFCEHYGLPLIDPARLSQLTGSDAAYELVELSNPISSDLSVLRPVLLPDLLAAAARNLNNGISNVRLFETGLVFASTAQSLPSESWHLAGIVFGQVLADPWDRKNCDFDFYDLKGAVRSLFAALQLGDATIRADQSTEKGKTFSTDWPIDDPSSIRADQSTGKGEAFLHPGRSAEIILDGKKIGCLGELDPRAAKEYELKARGYYFQIELEPVIARLAGPSLQFCELPRFPAVKRDLALAVKQEIACRDLETVIRAAGGLELAEVRLFDLYQGGQIAAGHKSMAFSLVFRSPDRTLTDDEVNTANERIVRALKEKAGAEVRTE